jgi:hypothetical protein
LVVAVVVVWRDVRLSIHHALVLFLLVCMDGLAMLMEIIETRKLFSAVTREGPFKKKKGQQT